MKKLLIIEDDQIVANIYRNKFSVEGFQVEIARDGESGLETVHAFHPDVIILDLMLPKLTGVDILKTLRGQPGFEKTPVVVFSNTYLSNLVQEAWRAGATKCLSKANCTPKHVIEVIRGLFPPDETAKLKGAASPPAEAAASGDVDAEFQAELRESFTESLPATLTAVRALLKDLIRSDSEVNRLKQLHEFYRRIHALTGNAAIAGMVHIAQMADALEALLKELYEKPKNINASTLRTVAHAVDFLAMLFEHGNINEAPGVPPLKILVVDDEALSRRAISFALEKARLQSVNVEDPHVAFKLLSENQFDLVFLDVDMPGMNGFELCAKLRTLPMHVKTPVVFVTSLTDFESRASSSVSGGNDFIAKPFLFIELTVKALVYILRGRLEAARADQRASAAK